MKKILFDLYLSMEPTILKLTRAQVTKILPFASRKSITDPARHKHWVYQLNDNGKKCVEAWLHLYGRNPDGKGICIHKRDFYALNNSPSFTRDDLEKFLSDVLSIPYEIEDMNGGSMVRAYGLNDALVQKSIDIRWDSIKDDAYLKSLKINKHIWNYLIQQRGELMNDVYCTEIFLWGI